jgi:hypothetical protein
VSIKNLINERIAANKAAKDAWKIRTAQQNPHVDPYSQMDLHGGDKRAQLQTARLTHDAGNPKYDKLAHKVELKRRASVPAPAPAPVKKPGLLARAKGWFTK